MRHDWFGAPRRQPIYLADSPRRVIYRAPYDPATGNLGERLDRLFITSKSRNAAGEVLDAGLGGSVFSADELPAPGTAEPRFNLLR